MPSSSAKLHVFLIDSIGAHRGMHYYNFALGEALRQEGVGVILLSTLETANHAWKPESLPVKGVFRHIYGVWPKWIRGLWYGWALLWIVWLAWRQRPDIVHYHFYQIPFLDRFLLYWLRLLNVIVVSNVHDVVPLDTRPGVRTKVSQRYQRLYSLSNGLIVHSRQSLISLGILDGLLLEKTMLIPHGNFLHVARQLTSSQKQSRQMLNLVADDPIIMVFGSIKPNKRLDWAIKMFPNVLASFPKAQLVIVGQPQDQDIVPYVALAQELAMSDRIVWHLDAVEDVVLLSYFSAADVVLFPYEWIYQSGVLVMAMSFGKPVVATAVGGNKDLILPNKTGVLVTPGDIDEMGQALIDLLSNQKKAQQIGTEAKEYVATALSWEHIALETRQYYLQLAAEKTELDLLVPSTRFVSLPPPK